MLAEALQRSGRTVWWDTSLLAGSTWNKEITDKLQQAKCIVVLWSESSINSEFVHDEAEEGKRARKLVPAIIDPVRPPLGFGQRHYTSLVHWQGEPDHGD